MSIATDLDRHDAEALVQRIAHHHWREWQRACAMPIVGSGGLYEVVATRTVIWKQYTFRSEADFDTA